MTGFLMLFLVLRSSTYPEGFPNLKGTNLKRVTAANKLYAFLTKVVLRAHDKNIIFVIENPRSSLFWLTTFFQKIKHLFTFVAHQACAYGSSRPKWTASAVNRPEFLVLNQTCPGESASHVHKPWGLSHTGAFATAEETAYPLPLARAIACAFQDALKSDGWKWPASEWSELHSDPSFAAMRAVAGRQPKASKVPPLVPEFKSIVTVLGPLDLVNNPPCTLMTRLKSAWVCPQTFSNSIASIPQVLSCCAYPALGPKGVKIVVRKFVLQSWYGASLGAVLSLYRKQFIVVILEPLGPFCPRNFLTR